MGSSSLLLAVLLAGSSIPGVSGASQRSVPRYTIISLGTLGGASSISLGINELGQVVGSADRTDGRRHAFLWDDGVMTDLGTLPGRTLSEAWDINNQVEVVGISSTAGSPFLWAQGEMIDLRSTPGVPSSLQNTFAINDSTEIVGNSRISLSDTRALLLRHGSVIDLGTLEGGSSSNAWDINRLGHVVGGADPGEVPGGAYLWIDGVMSNLGTVGGDISFATGLNDVGQVVGQSERTPGARDFHAFLWEDGDMIDLGALGGFSASGAWAINDSGEVVGFPSFLFSPLWGMEKIGDVLPADSGWFSVRPRDINDAGQIVGDGVFQGSLVAFLMTPLPPADCNSNGVEDVNDIANGTSLNCNGNAIPDECEGDSDGDGVIDDCDGCPQDSNKTEPGRCGCGNKGETDTDGDGVPDCVDQCPGIDDATFAPECEGAVPAVSQWGLITLALLLLVAAKIYFSCAGKT